MYVQHKDIKPLLEKNIASLQCLSVLNWLKPLWKLIKICLISDFIQFFNLRFLLVIIPAIAYTCTGTAWQLLECLLSATCYLLPWTSAILDTVIQLYESIVTIMINFILLFSRQGKLRLQKWYEAKDSKDKKKVVRDLTSMILQRKPKMCNFIEYKDLCVVYKRYASLFFCFAVDRGDNELGVLEVIHRCVERSWRKL